MIVCLNYLLVTNIKVFISSLIILLVGTNFLLKEPKAKNYINVLVVKSINNLDTYKKQNKEYRDVLNKLYKNIEDSYDGEELVILAETTLPNDVDSIYYDIYKKRFKELAKNLDTTILIGGKLNNQENVTFMFNEKEQYSSKEELFPFGEYLPLKNVLKYFFPMVGEVRVDSNNSVILNQKHIKILNLICYESVNNNKFLKFNGQYNLIINPTNEIWFGEKGTRLTEALTRMKSVESNKTLIRVSTKGNSGIYVPGKRDIVFKGDKEGVSLYSKKIPIIEENSFYLKYFDYIKWLPLILLFSFRLLPFLLKRKNN